jgi:predicted dithiol-disulfide oxidoreductase (DUF899 family)
MQYAEPTAKLAQYGQQIAELHNRMRELQRSVEPEKVAGYEFSTAEGKVGLSELFGEKQYLIVIHNMGAGCRYCTLWADGFNGILPHHRKSRRICGDLSARAGSAAKIQDRARLALSYGVPSCQLCRRHGLPR